MARLTKKMFEVLERGEIRLLAKHMKLPVTKMYSSSEAELISFVWKNAKSPEEDKYIPLVDLNIKDVVAPTDSGTTIFRDGIGEYLIGVQNFIENGGDAPSWPPKEETEPPFDVDEEVEATEDEAAEAVAEEPGPKAIAAKKTKAPAKKSFKLSKRTIGKKGAEPEDTAPAAPVVDMGLLNQVKESIDELTSKSAGNHEGLAKEVKTINKALSQLSTEVAELGNLMLLMYNQTCEVGKELSDVSEAPTPDAYLVE